MAFGWWTPAPWTDRQIFQYTEDNHLEVTRLYHDLLEGKVWVGTSDSGLFLYDLEHNLLSPLLSHSFPKQPVQTFVANTDTTVMVGIDGPGNLGVEQRWNRVLTIYKENPDNPHSLKGNGVYDMYRSGGRIWVSTYTGGLSYFDQGSAAVTQLRTRLTTPIHWGNNNVNKIVEDRPGKPMVCHQ